MENSNTKTIEFKHGNFSNKLTIIKELGRGAYGQVVLGEDERGRKFAVKKVRSENRETYYTIAQELGTLVDLKHENIVKLYSIDFIENTCMFVMEFCEGGTLNERLEDPVDQNTQLEWMKQLAEALSYLHLKGIVHRDLKPESVLLKDEKTLKLSDFGIAKMFYGLARGIQPQQMGTNEYLSEYLEEGNKMGTFAGTPYWIAPEVFDHDYDEKADVFSLGVIFYAIATRSWFLYNNKKYFGAFVEQHGRRIGVGQAMADLGQQIFPDFQPPDYEKCSQDFKIVIRKMLFYNPKQRLNAEECVRKLNPVRRSIPVFKTTSNEKTIDSDIGVNDSDQVTDLIVVDDGEGEQEEYKCCIRRLLCCFERNNNNQEEEECDNIEPRMTSKV